MSEIDFDALMASDEPAETPVTAEPEPASTESPAVKLAELDALIPDSDDVDEDFRGKPLADVIRVARQHKEEAKQGYTAKQRVKDLESRASIAERMLERFSSQSPQQEQQPDVMGELRQRLQALEFSTYQSQAELARERARNAAGVDAETWQELRQPLAAIISAMESHPSDERAWTDALDTYKKHFTKLAKKAEVVKAPPPPAGQARSQSRAVAAGPKLSDRDRRNLAELAAGFGIKPGTKAFEELEADIAGGN